MNYTTNWSYVPTYTDANFNAQNVASQQYGNCTASAKATQSGTLTSRMTTAAWVSRRVCAQDKDLNSASI